jgi:hypothetical protein
MATAKKKRSNIGQPKINDEYFHIGFDDETIKKVNKVMDRQGIKKFSKAVRYIINEAVQ